MKRVISMLIVAGLMAGCSTFGHKPPPEFNVFFHAGSAALTPEAVQIVDSAAVSIREDHPGTVIVSAGTSPGDSNKFAEARFNAVQAELAARGVSASLIARATLVENPVELGATADRRVEIKLVAANSP